MNRTETGSKHALKETQRRKTATLTERTIMKGEPPRGLLHNEGETRVGGFVFMPWRNLRVPVGQAWAGAGQRGRKKKKRENTFGWRNCTYLQSVYKLWLPGLWLRDDPREWETSSEDSDLKLAPCSVYIVALGKRPRRCVLCTGDIPGGAA